VPEDEGRRRGGGFDSVGRGWFAADMEKTIWLIPLLGLALFTGCASKPPLKAVDYVDLPRFIGQHLQLPEGRV
jgi:hypothetical protein